MSRTTPNPLDKRPRTVRAAGSVGALDVDPRGDLLEKGGITVERQAEAAAKSFDKKVALLDAQKTVFFQHEGEVNDSRVVDALDVQLRAAEAIDRMVGVNAPPSTRSVVVTHQLEWPEWYRGPGQEAVTIIDVEPSGGQP